MIKLQGACLKMNLIPVYAKAGKAKS